MKSIPNYMGRKGQLEVSTSFIVMLILAIVVFGFGIYFATNLFTTVKPLVAQLNQNQEQQVENALDQGQQVAFPVTTQTVQAGSNAIYGLGVLNTRTVATTFSVTINCTVAVDAAQNSLGAVGCEGAWTFPINSFTLNPNDKIVIPVSIHAISSKPSGTYGFNVEVYAQDTSTPSVPPKLYDTVKQIYLDIS